MFRHVIHVPPRRRQGCKSNNFTFYLLNACEILLDLLFDLT